MYEDMWQRITKSFEKNKTVERRKLYVMELEALTESNPIVAKELQQEVRGRGGYMDALERVIVHLCEENKALQSIINNLTNEILKEQT